MRSVFTRHLRSSPAPGWRHALRDAVRAGFPGEIDLEVGEDTDRRAHEEVGGDEIEHRRQPEEEGEAANLADGEGVEHDSSDQARHIGLHDRRVGDRERPLDGRPNRATTLHILLQMLEVHDVGVDRHTDRHDQARDPGERERKSLRGAEPGDNGPQQCPGDQQRHDRHDTEVAVIGDQIDRDEQHADETGEHAGIEGILTEGGTDDAALLRGEFERGHRS